MDKYEVFISFKNTDYSGERTTDSMMAEKLYYALKEKGINAFYSNKSIKDAGGHRFGKAIDEALEQCIIFVAIGSNLDNLNSQWVNYEVECFKNEMLNGNKVDEQSAMLSYITKDVPVNKLPMALRRCQAYFELEDVVEFICTRLKHEDKLLKNFIPAAPEPEAEIQIGKVIDGRFQILMKIGEGGMSSVYMAWDKRLNKQWAVKV